LNLYQVAVHEIGHALGLPHSEDKNSVMSPFYREYNPNFRLSYSDIETVHAIYGKTYLKTFSTNHR